MIRNGELDITNSAFWQNKSDAGISSFKVSDSFGPINTDIDYSLIQEAECNQPHFTNVTCGSNMIYAQDPMLSFNANPKSGSPLINNGRNGVLIGELYDQTGVTPRVLENSIDIGAREHRAPCQSTLILDPSDPLFANSFGRLRGMWQAENSITVMPGFDTGIFDWLILDAPEVNILNDYEYVDSQFNSNQSMEIRQEGCN